MAPRRRSIDWEDWLRRWDGQQEGYMPYREDRFSVMTEVVAALSPPDVRVVDLACGPGSLGVRILRRLPRARVVAVDFDPVLLELGRHALAGYRRRLTWVEADLRDPEWVREIPPGPIDAILTTTALHWLSAPNLTRLYAQIRQLVGPKGLFMNGDHMAFDPALPRFRTIAKTLNSRRTSAGFANRRRERWEDWWTALEKEPSLAPLFEERRRRYPAGHGRETEYLARFHSEALRAAGFREVSSVWQTLDNRVLLALP